MFFRYPVSTDLQDWIVESFGWAVRHGLLHASTPLVQASGTYFPAPRGKTSADTVEGLFTDLRRLLGLEGADLALAPLDVLAPEHRSPLEAASVAGTWQAHEGMALIRYDPALIERPVVLIATLAHELMHHVLHQVDGEPPGGPAAHELSTDLHVITSGFGLLAMGAAEQSGWHGYLSQPSRAHALAVFLRVAGHDSDAALRLLPPRSAGLVRKALRHVAADDPALAELRRDLAEARTLP